MPIPRTRQVEITLDSLSKDRAGELKRGLNWFGGFGGDEHAFLTAWQAVGDEITAEHVKTSPGTRPYGWWVARASVDKSIRLHLAGPARRENQGPFVFEHDVPGYDRQGVIDETAYLRVHNLLTADEHKALEDDRAQPYFNPENKLMIRHLHNPALRALVPPAPMRDPSTRTAVQMCYTVPHLDPWGGSDVTASDLAHARYQTLVHSCAVSGSVGPADEAELLLISPEIGIRPADVLTFFRADVQQLTGG